MNNNQTKKAPKPGEAGEYIPHVNKGIAIAGISVFMALIIIPTLIWGVLMLAGNSNQDLMVALHPDTKENRAMAKFPDKFDPEKVTVELENWYNDHLPFRSLVYNTYMNTTNTIEKPYEESIRPILLEFFSTQSPPPNSDISNPDDPIGGGDIFGDGDDIFGDGEDTDETEDGGEIGWDTEEVPPLEDTELPPEYDDEHEVPNDCEHVLDAGVIETPATCSDWGVMAYTCTKNCGYVKRQYTAKADHTLGQGTVETPATCDERGVMAYPCTVCGKTYREYIAKLKHQYVDNSTSTPLCGVKYEKTSTCSLCGNEKTSTVVKKHVEGKKLAQVNASYTTYGYTLIQCADCKGEYRTNIKNKHTDYSNFIPYYRSDTVLEGKFKWLFYRGNNSEAYFAGTNPMSDAELADYVATMTQLNELCKQKGIQFQICIWPNKEQVYPEYVGTTPVTMEKRADLLVDYVTKNSDVKIIYPLAELKAMKPYYDTYLKYDTHWNCVGGFVGYQMMLKSLGLETTDLRNCPVFEYTGVEKENLDPYYRQISGDMIGLGGLSSANYNGDHNYFVKYRTDVEVDTFSGLNGAGDTRHTTASKAPFDYNFVMLGDSYRVMQLTYLEKDFTDCFLTHRSHVNDADVKEAIKNADILVISAVERLEPDILATARQIINILSE